MIIEEIKQPNTITHNDLCFSHARQRVQYNDISIWLCSECGAIFEDDAFMTATNLYRAHRRPKYMLSWESLN